MDYKKRFFSQSYKNALMDYVYMCENSESHAWDRVILTASNEQQAEAYRLQRSKIRFRGSNIKCFKKIGVRLWGGKTT